jgi:enoyl-CoA hydratase
MEYHDLLLHQEGGALWVTLNRPHVLNALDRRLANELRTLFTEIAFRPDVRVIVLRGAGCAFCAGMDLKAPRYSEPGDPDRGMIRQRELSQIFVAMRRCPQPIIAILNGAASGGGMALALASDIRLATPDMRMNAAFVKVGLSGCDVGVSYFLPRMVGSSIAAELMLTGRFIDAGNARALGLVSRVVEPDNAEAAARDLAAELLAASPLGLALTKDGLNHAMDASSIEAAIAIEDRNQILCTQSSDFEEGIAAFMERRAPRYQGRDTVRPKFSQ